ncbi:MAG: iron ABC transporter [Rickettsiales bacterium]|nr:iron ABC transporter [Rickettsiales bacterium]|tara:strand:- start:9042 stop:10097 length:1056 start_codon:yes stop_codon:yes gene_type:complete
MKNHFEIKNATFLANKQKTIKNVSFKIQKKGSIICLLGPSGVGKTTILRTIAGLNKLNSGEIILNGKVISSKQQFLEPEKRNIALSFQENSLFPHKNVIENINLGLERKYLKKKILSAKYLLDIFDLEEIKYKYPHEISTGESQRVSIARALISSPELLLLDEPFSNIDQILRLKLQEKIKKIVSKTKISTIVVTHDPNEAFYLGDKCGVVINGKLEQFDTPYNLYHYPNSMEIVNFFKKGALIPATVVGKNELFQKELGKITGNFVKDFKKGTQVKLLIQPDDLEHDDSSNLKLIVVEKKFRGTDFIYTLKTKNNLKIPVLVHSHHIHQHDIKEKFGIKLPIHINHLVCF